MSTGLAAPNMLAAGTGGLYGLFSSAGFLSSPREGDTTCSFLSPCDSPPDSGLLSELSELSFPLSCLADFDLSSSAGGVGFNGTVLGSS